MSVEHFELPPMSNAASRLAIAALLETVRELTPYLDVAGLEAARRLCKRTDVVALSELGGILAECRMDVLEGVVRRYSEATGMPMTYFASELGWLATDEVPDFGPAADV